VVYEFWECGRLVNQETGPAEDASGSDIALQNVVATSWNFQAVGKMNGTFAPRVIAIKWRLEKV
jgi:hypothetical protein